MPVPMLMRPGSQTGETNGISEIHIVSAVATSGEFGILAVKTQKSTSGKLGHHFSGLPTLRQLRVAE